MILIADAGSTKTSWALINKNEILQLETGGINPVWMSDDQISAAVENITSLNLRPLEMFFFGAGCIGVESPQRIKKLLSRHWPNAKINVQSDMIAACISTCGDNPGLVFILGTGSNSCYWNGKEIVAQAGSGGYLLGDEGSGSAMGKVLLRNVIRRKLNNHIIAAFEKEFDLNTEGIIGKLYKDESPAAFLASFTPFIKKNLHDSDIANIPREAFFMLYQEHVDYYLRNNIQFSSIHFIGSVAHYFQEQLIAVFSPLCVPLHIEQRPIERLINYYQKKFEL
jgi:N-acetylglucosamine kinase-like BadF-type ATPase